MTSPNALSKRVLCVETGTEPGVSKNFRGVASFANKEAQQQNLGWQQKNKLKPLTKTGLSDIFSEDKLAMSIGVHLFIRHFTMFCLVAVVH